MECNAVQCNACTYVYVYIYRERGREREGEREREREGGRILLASGSCRALDPRPSLFVLADQAAKPR